MSWTECLGQVLLMIKDESRRTATWEHFHCFNCCFVHSLWQVLHMKNVCVCVCVCLVHRWWLRQTQYKAWGRLPWCHPLRSQSEWVYRPQFQPLQVCATVTSVSLHSCALATSATDIGNNVPLIWYKDKPGDTSKFRWSGLSVFNIHFLWSRETAPTIYPSTCVTTTTPSASAT